MARGHRELKLDKDTFVRAQEVAKLLKLRQVEPRDAVAALAIATAGTLREWQGDKRADMLINFEEIVVNLLEEKDKEAASGA